MAGFKGAIFDVDGVLVDSPHEDAWREGLKKLMENEWQWWHTVERPVAGQDAPAGP